jgi:tetratricopeptide (TPR) repeat protein
MADSPELATAVAQAVRLLMEADAVVTAAAEFGADPARLGTALAGADQAIALLEPAPRNAALRQMLAYAWMIRGNVLRGQGAGVAPTLQAYDTARELLAEAAADPAAHYLRDTLANVWTNRGITLLTGDAEALAEAVDDFDQAIALRSTLPLAENPWYRYGLTSGWMNRADALTRLGGPAKLDEAVRSYDEALVHLRELPAGENPLFRKRLAIAWVNRGLTLLTRGTAPALTEALRSFDEAIASLGPATGHPELHLILAGAWMNRGNTLLRVTPPAAFDARGAASSALMLVAEHEAREVIAAEIGFKARHIRCQAIAQILPVAGDAWEAPDQLVADATDTVDEGLALARQWELRGETRFRPLACELFRFGARVYQQHQPHFLVEFLVESLDPEQSPGAPSDLREMHTAAAEALWQALRDLQQEGFKTLHTPRFEELLAQLKELRIAEGRLAELRRAAGI